MKIIKVKMMNKEEVIEKIEASKRPLVSGKTFDHALDIALNIVKQLDELEKPVVPQFVADWYEENKNDFEYNLAHLINDYFKGEIEDDNLMSWFDYDFNFDRNKPIQTLINMHKFGYEVKKEKLYTAKNKLTGTYLAYKDSPGYFHAETSCAILKYAQHEWEALGVWNNTMYELEEVLND